MGPEPQDCSGTSPLRGQGPKVRVPSQGQLIERAPPGRGHPAPGQCCARGLLPTSGPCPGGSRCPAGRCHPGPWLPRRVPRRPYQGLLADDEQPTRPAALGQPHFLVEGAVPPRHQRDLVAEAFGREVGRRAEHGARPVPQLQERLRQAALTRGSKVLVGGCEGPSGPRSPVHPPLSAPRPPERRRGGGQAGGAGRWCSHTPQEPSLRLQTRCVHRGQTRGAGAAVRAPESPRLRVGPGQGATPRRRGGLALLRCTRQGRALDGNTSFARDKETATCRGLWETQASTAPEDSRSHASAPAGAAPLPPAGSLQTLRGAAGQQVGPHSPPC